MQECFFPFFKSSHPDSFGTEFPIESFNNPLHNCAPTCRGCAIPHSMGTVASPEKIPRNEFKLSGYPAIRLFSAILFKIEVC